MAYTPTVWSDNEAIPATSLNKLEAGVTDATETADKAIKAAAEAQGDATANAEDIARLFDEVEALRQALNELTAE